MSSDDGTKSDNGVEIILAAIFVLIGIVVMVIIFQIYARHLLRRQASRRRAGAILFPPSSNVVVPTELDMIEPQRGLDGSAIASLPTFNYRANDQRSHGEAVECSVCLSTIVEEALVRLLPNCKHLFHVECIDKWLTSHGTCPICRTVAEPRVQPECSKLEVVQPMAPLPEEATSNGAVQLDKEGGSDSRISSFRGMLSRERASAAEDLERQ